MANVLTLYAQTITWNSKTWNATSGGPLEVRISRTGTVLRSLTADDVYSRGTFVVDKDLIIGVKLQDLAQITVEPGDGPSNMVITLKQGSGSTTGSVITAANMIATDVNAGQIRANLGEIDMAFTHQSADGATDPVSVA